MKTVLTKFRLSNFLDEKQPIPDSLRTKVNASPELHEFTRKTGDLDRALRRSPSAPAEDPMLHNCIMRSVRASAAESAPANTPMRVGFATMLAGLAAICLWLAARPTAPALPTASSKAQTLAAAQAVFDMGGEISRTMPSSMVAPLTNELACVDHDIRDTTQFVMGMLPSSY